MAPALPLGLRNRLAELILAAFDDPEAGATLAALAAFCGADDGTVGEPAAARLLPLGWFEPAGPGRLHLRGAHRAHRDALCRRARAGVAAVGAARPDPGGATLPALLARAARLADAGLHFEVHELLEPAWLSAAGDERLGLQGLIQVAVAFHHAAHDNREGALALLAEGLAKLDRAGRALPVDAVAWLSGIRAVLAAWRTGAEAPPAPRWPTPAGARWGAGSGRGESA